MGGWFIINNYHRHTSYSNIYIADSAATNEDYAKRAIELGHKVLSSVEHGWQGYYFETYELAKKYNIPIVEDEDTARTLMKLDIGKEIPYSLYGAVSVILRHVYKLKESL